MRQRFPQHSDLLERVQLVEVLHVEPQGLRALLRCDDVALVGEQCLGQQRFLP